MRLAVPGPRAIAGAGIIGDRFAQRLHVPRRGLCWSKRHRDAGFAESIEDGEPQLHARVTTFFEVINKRVEFEVQSVCAELEIHGSGRRRHDIGIVSGNLEKGRPDLAGIAAVAQAKGDHDAANVVAKSPVLHLFGDETRIWNENARSLGGLDLR